MTEEFDPSCPNLSPKLNHAFDLIFALCEGQIASREFRELESLVSRDAEVRTFYINMMQTRSILRSGRIVFDDESMTLAALPPTIGAT